MALSEDQELVQELRKIYNDDDFLIGIMSIAKTEENRETILDFIHTAKKMGDEATSDEITLLALKLGHGKQRKEET